MDIATITAFIFSGIALLLCAWLILVRHKLTQSNKVLQNKLVLIENNLLLTKESNRTSSAEKNEKAVQQKVTSENVSHAQAQHPDLINLRKENAKFKDEIKKLKDEVKSKEKALKEEEKASKNKLYSLTEENSRFILQLKELDSQLSEALSRQRNTVPLIDFEKKLLEISQFKEENAGLKAKLNESEKNKKLQLAKINSLQEKLKLTESDLAQWQEAAKTNDGKPLDPTFFIKWHDRALTARKMYKLMRQMRELSDSKVNTYQDGVVALAKWILSQKNMAIPRISAGEVPADRLLAEAWNAIMPVSPVAMDRTESKSIAAQHEMPS